MKVFGRWEYAILKYGVRLVSRQENPLPDLTSVQGRSC